LDPFFTSKWVVNVRGTSQDAPIASDRPFSEKLVRDGFPESAEIQRHVNAWEFIGYKTGSKGSKKRF
jgi:hypothetical protein